MKSLELYEQVIDLLSVEQDWKKICFNMAKINPKLFYQAILGTKFEKPWQMKVKEMMVAGGTRIDAVKYVRNETGMGLKEALEVVKAIEEG